MGSERFLVHLVLKLFIQMYSRMHLLAQFYVLKSSGILRQEGTHPSKVLGRRAYLRALSWRSGKRENTTTPLITTNAHIF